MKTILEIHKKSKHIQTNPNLNNHLPVQIKIKGHTCVYDEQNKKV